VDWHIANRSGPVLRTRTRAEKRSFGASDEILKIVVQMISRQNENRSRSGIESVDQKAMCAPVSNYGGYAQITTVAPSTSSLALQAKTPCGCVRIHLPRR
jgi:hypothetical protein